MASASDLELPEFDLSDASLVAATYHEQLAALRARTWLARSSIALLVLDRAAGEFFLRSKSVAFPGREIAALFDITAGPLYEHIDANILNLTGDQHRRLRSIVSRAFTPVAADRWRPTMTRILTQLWGERGDEGSFEFVDAFAKPYPALTIAAVLGAPAEDAPRLHEWSTLVQRQFDLRALSTERAAIEQAVVEVTSYVESLLSSPRQDAGDTLLSSLLAAEADGDRLSHDECVNLAVNVLAGAIDTTQSQLSHAMLLFAAHPEQWSALHRTPTLAAQAVSEILRVEPVAPFTARICLEDIDYGGTVFEKGTILAICAERANREAPAGEVFDITEARGGRLLTFGAGQHFCLGANLARAELEEALAFLSRRMAHVRLDGPIERGSLEGIYGVETLPLRWAPDAR